MKEFFKRNIADFGIGLLSLLCFLFVIGAFNKAPKVTPLTPQAAPVAKINTSVIAAKPTAKEIFEENWVVGGHRE